MKGLFQCPPWARSFCPFRACGASVEMGLPDYFQDLKCGRIAAKNSFA